MTNTSTDADANICQPSEPSSEEDITPAFAAMEEGSETNIQTSYDDENVTMDMHHRPNQMMTHLSIMGEDSPLMLGTTAAAEKKKKKKARNWQKTYCWMVRSLWKSYEESIERYPLWTKSWTSGLLTSLGDLVSQLISHHSVAEISLYESCKFFLLGMCVQAPISHYYYLALDDKFPPTPNPWTKTTLIKLMIDQLLFAPSFLLVVFVFLDILDGQLLHYGEMGHHLRQDFGSTLIANWKLWLPATIINLAFVSPEYRVLYSNIIFFVWTILLAMLVVVPTATTTTTT